MNMIYTLHTENVGRKGIADMVSKYFQGFSMTDSTGYYKGKAERSVAIVICATVTQAHIIRFLGKLIAQRNNQECVLITAQRVTGEYVNGY